MTASRWIEPLKSEYIGTKIDARTSKESDESDVHQQVDIEDVGAEKLQMIRQVASGEEAEELIREVATSELSQRDVRDAIDELVRVDGITSVPSVLGRLGIDPDRADEVREVVRESSRVN